jgi:uncharacterized membrane protein
MRVGEAPEAIRSTESQSRDFPPHIEEAVQALARLHVQHQKAATPLQRMLGLVTSTLADPRFIGAVGIAVAGWMAFNGILLWFSYFAPDPPPFVWLGFGLSLSSLYMVLLVYANQRRDDELAEIREQLTLELALLNDKKTAKLIQLLEEFRRDIPIVDDRDDPQAKAMAEPVPPERVIAAIRETQAEQSESLLTGDRPVSRTQSRTGRGR